jgi:8-oxo-dGTP diphosphatase
MTGEGHPNPRLPQDGNQANDAPRDVVEVAAGLVFRNGLLLITQRPPDAHLGGLWEFPGGKRQAAESYEDCLRRELREELDIEVEIEGLYETITHEYPDKAVHLRFFRCVWRQNEPRALGVSDFAWVGKSQLGNYSFPAADNRLLGNLLASEAAWR